MIYRFPLTSSFHFSTKIVDAETAFVYGDLSEVYMNCNELHQKDEALYLNKSIYGLVQATRQFYIKFTDILKRIGFKGGYPDPYL